MRKITSLLNPCTSRHSTRSPVALLLIFCLSIFSRHAQAQIFTNYFWNSESNYWSSEISTPEAVCGRKFCHDRSSTFYRSDLVSLKNAVLDTLPSDSCNQLYDIGLGLSQGLYKQAYDTLRYFIEHCYYTGFAPAAFSTIGGNVQYINKDLNRWPAYREWLLSVLYLNTTDPNYYCKDVDQLLITFKYVPGRGYDINGGLAVAKYLIETNRCPMLTQHLKDGWAQSRADQYLGWQDSVTVDTNIYKIDTTLPSLEDLGLGILRENPARVAPSTSYIRDPILGSVAASSNPFQEETFLTIEMLQTGVVKFELFNELGEVVQQNDIGRLIQKGIHQISLNGTNMTGGNYYARFSTPYGEIKALKLQLLK